MRARGPVFAAAAGATILLFATTAAVAGTVDRVQVGVSGRNATQGLSPALYVDVPVVADYALSHFDGEQGDWQGPTYTATQSTTTGRTDLFFRSDFENNVGSLDGMAEHALVHKDWTLAQKNAVKVPRLLGGRPAGTLGGKLVVYAEPIAGSARWESVLAIPLCHGVFVGMDFYADAPPSDTSGTSQYLVGTTPAKQWNHDHALAAARGVKLDGPLPGPRVAAHLAGRTLAGVVRDCGGGLQNVQLTLQRKSGAGWATAGHGTSRPGGKFSLPAGAPGSYRVVAKLGPFHASSGSIARR
ncbi:MAG: hypothetical protein ACRDKC_02685 [Gaiellaceae bacterium]